MGQGPAMWVWVGVWAYSMHEGKGFKQIGDMIFLTY